MIAARARLVVEKRQVLGPRVHNDQRLEQPLRVLVFVNDLRLVLPLELAGEGLTTTLQRVDRGGL